MQFEVTQEHIKLIQQLNWEVNWNHEGIPFVDQKRPFGNSNIENNILKIIGEEQNPEYDEWSKTQYKKAEKLLKELPTALSICTHFLEFKPGKFEREDCWYNWRKV